MEKGTVPVLKNNSLFKIIFSAIALSLLSISVTFIVIVNTVAERSEAIKLNYYQDLLKGLIRTQDITQNISKFKEDFSHFDLDRRAIAIVGFDKNILYQSKGFDQQWFYQQEVDKALKSKNAISSHYRWFKVFFQARHYYKNDKTDLMVIFIDTKTEGLPRLMQFIFLLFFFCIFLCTAIILFVIVKKMKARAKEIEGIVTRLDTEKRTLVNEDFIDKYTRVPKVINHLLDTAYDAVKEKERIAQSKFELLSELTHDIRTPLTSIQTATETLCSGVEIKDEQKDTLHSIVSLDVSYLSKLVDDLLFLSILDERSEQSSRMTALVPLLDSLKEKYVSIASMKQISINYDSSDLHEILLPELEFLRLMNNLISNALFNAKTFVRLDVSLIDYQLRFLVENDFETIDKESINNFGKKKLKRKIDLKNKQSSIGLGSVIIASIVEKWGGKMEIELDEHSKIFRMNIIYPIKS
jgi:hypothetical protein